MCGNVEDRTTLTTNHPEFKTLTVLKMFFSGSS